MKSNVVPFVSRADLLARRSMKRYCQWKKLTKGLVPSDSPEASRWKDEALAERKADAEWAKCHGPIPGGAWIARFPGPDDDVPRAQRRSTGRRKKASR